jgi:hypothetical protein
MAESANILTKLQDLLVYLIAQLNKFPRDQKFVLGDRIETKLLDVQEDCQRASPAQRMSTCGRAKKQILISFATAGLCLARTLRGLAHWRSSPSRTRHSARPDEGFRLRAQSRPKTGKTGKTGKTCLLTSWPASVTIAPCWMRPKTNSPSPAQR